jgi:hypothetical protein
LARSDGAVSLPAVGLDHQAVLGEGEIGLETGMVGNVEGVVALRLRQTVVAGELAHERFELAARDALGVTRGR